MRRARNGIQLERAGQAYAGRFAADLTDVQVAAQVAQFHRPIDGAQFEAALHPFDGQGAADAGYLDGAVGGHLGYVIHFAGVRQAEESQHALAEARLRADRAVGGLLDLNLGALGVA